MRRSASCRLARLLLLTWVGALALPALALDPGRTLSQFHHTRWTAKDGAPLGIRKMTQTTDGWLWLGSTSGLYRFDGMRFERAAPAEDPAFGTRQVSTLAAGRDGDLWVGLLTGGVARIDRLGRLTVFELPADLRMRDIAGLAIQPSGTVWAATPTELLRFDGQAWRRLAPEWGLSLNRFGGMHVDLNGALWVADSGEWFRLDAGSARFLRTGFSSPGGRSARIIDGRSWMVTADRLIPFPGSEARDGRSGVPAPDSSAVWIDRQRNLWSAYCPSGLCRSRLPPTLSLDAEGIALPPVDDGFTARDGLSSDIGMTALEDRDGHLWIATQTGLDRFRDVPLARIAPSGAATNYTLLPGDGPRDSVATLEGTLIGGADASGPLLWRMAGGMPRRLSWPGEGGRIRALHRDAQARTWIGAANGLWRMDGDRPIRVTAPGPQGTFDCRQLVSNAQGLWALFRQEGLQLWRDDQWQPAPFPGLTAERPTAFALGPDGEVWTGYAGNRLRSTASHHEQAYGEAQGLNVGAVTFLHAGRRVLAVGDRGLQLLSQGRFHSLRVSESEADALRGVTGAQELPSGDLWLNGARGAVQISAAALAAFDASPAGPLPLRVLDAGDGYPAGGTPHGPQSSVVTARDGRLWFAGLDGVAWLEPTRLPAAPAAPRVLWREAAADGRWRPVRDGMTMPAGTQTVELRFTALALGAPERLRFQARLAGIDDDWRDLGAQRQLSYSHLPPGKRVLQVRASLGDGSPAGPPAELALVLPPTLTQTLAFRAFASLALLALVVIAVRWRTRRSTRREHELLRALMLDRERIAQEVNDTMLQGLQGLTLHFQKVANRMAMDDPNRRLMNRSLDRADELVLKGREQVAALRTGPWAQATELGPVLSALGERLAADLGKHFVLQQHGRARTLRPAALESIVQISQEILLHTLLDAHVERVTVAIHYRWHGLLLEIDGQGQAAGGRDARRARLARWSRSALPERLRALGGHLRMRPVAVDIRLPAHRLYAHPWRLMGEHAWTDVEDEATDAPRVTDAEDTGLAPSPTAGPGSTPPSSF